MLTAFVLAMRNWRGTLDLVDYILFFILINVVRIFGNKSVRGFHLANL